MGQAQIDPNQQHRGRRFAGGIQGTQAAGLSSAEEKLTALPGTMVEMACL
jgi:hypothetical protein